MRTGITGIVACLLLSCAAAASAASTAWLETSVLPQPHASVHAVRAPLALLLERSGSRRPFDPRSVRASLERDGRRLELPVRVERHSDVDRIVFEVPGQGSRKRGVPPVVPTAVRIDFGSQAVAAGPAFAAPANLLGAELSKEPIRLAPTEADPEPRVSSPWLRVTPGESLRVSFSARVEATTRARMYLYAAVFFKDARRKSLPRHAAVNRVGSTGGGSKPFEGIVDVPTGASWAFVYLKATIPGSKVSVDDLRVVPAEDPEILVARTAGGTVAVFAQDADLWRFDFGPPDAPVLSPFESVTPQQRFGPGTAFGWTTPSRVKAKDRGFPADGLSQDFVTSPSGAFRVRVRNGRYRVWLRFGDYSAERRYDIYRGVTLDVEGERVFASNPSAKEVFEEDWLRHYPDLWHTGMDLYRTFVDPVFTERSVDVSVEDGVLDVGLQNLPLNAMIVFPLREASDAARFAAEQDALRERLVRLTGLELPEAVDPSLPFVPTRAESERGFVLFRMPRETRVLPTTRPGARDRVEALSVRAGRAETEWAFFSVYPLRDLRGVEIRVGDLAGPGGSFPPQRIDRRFVRYQPVLRQDRGVEIAATVLDRRPALDLEAGVPVRFAVRLQVDATQRAGRYSGSVSLAADGRPAARLPLVLDVLPFVLPAPRIDFGLYYSGGTEWYTQFWKANVTGPLFDGDPDMDRITFAAQRAHFAFMKDVGYTGAAFKDDLRYTGDRSQKILRGSLIFDGTVPQIDAQNRFVRFMDAYAAAGLGRMPFYGFQPIGRPGFIQKFLRVDAPDGTPAWRETYLNLIAGFEKVRIERGWPEILWYLSDELSNHGQEGVDRGIELGRLTDDLPGVRTISSLNGQKEMQMVPYLDIAMPNSGFPLVPQSLAGIREAGAELWLYNVGDSRFSFGLYPWALGAKGRYQWQYGVLAAKERWDLVKAKPWGVQKRGPGYEILAFEVAEQHREGIDDYRHLQALEDAILEAEGKPGLAAEVQAARAFLGDLRARVPVDIREVWDRGADARSSGGTGTHGIAAWSELEKIRRLCQDHLLALGAGA